MSATVDRACEKATGRAIIERMFESSVGVDPDTGDLLAAVRAELRAETPLVVADAPGDEPWADLDDDPEWCDEVIGLAPNGSLARVLGTVPAAAIGTSELVDVVEGWQRLASWAQAGRATAIAELAARTEMKPSSSGAPFESVNPVTVTALELTVPLGLTARRAENLVGHAITLVEDFPATHTALAAGRLDEQRARVITDELGDHDPAQRAQVEEAVLGQSGTLGPATPVPDATALRRQVKRALHELAPTTMSQRRQRAQANRFARVTPAADGMAWLEAYLPAEDAMAIKSTLDSAAATLTARDRAAHAADPEVPVRSLGQARADALTRLAWQALSAGRLGAGEPENSTEVSTDDVRLSSRHGRPAMVNLTMPISLLLEPHGDGDPDSAKVAELDGYGPIPADVARSICADGSWRRILTDPTSGTVLDYGTTRYSPPRALIDHVIARDRECRAPGCHVSASSCEVDHTVPFPRGPTSAANLGPFCKRHHLLKHHTGWQVEQPEPGTFIWVSPLGRRHVIRSTP